MLEPVCVRKSDFGEGEIMSQRVIAKTKFTGVVTAGALAVGVFAAAGLGSAPAANASCASFFGINNGGGCTSTPLSIAIAIGSGATAIAQGLFGAAVSLGNGAFTRTYDAFDFATAVGPQTSALAAGVFALATQLGGSGSEAVVLGPGSPGTGKIGANIALGVGDTGPTQTVAAGFGNIGFTLFDKATGSSTQGVSATGFVNTAAGVGGTDNFAIAGKGTGFGNVAFNILGSGSEAEAAFGPFAWAGTLSQIKATVTQSHPGINLYTRVALGAASVRAKPAAAARAATATSQPKPASAAKAAAATAKGRKP